MTDSHGVKKASFLYSRGNQLCVSIHALELPGRSGWSWSPPRMASLLSFLLSTSLFCFLLSSSPESHLNKSQESPSQGQNGFPRNKDRYFGSQLLSVSFHFGAFPSLACWIIYFLYSDPSLLELLCFLQQNKAKLCELGKAAQPFSISLHQENGTHDSYDFHACFGDIIRECMWQLPTLWLA